MKSPTLHDVARLAGVSYATADRVLNERGNVAQKSVVRVQSAVDQLGYVRNIAAANLAKSRTYRLAFVIPHRRNDFFARMHRHLDKAKPNLNAARVEIDVIDFNAFELEALERTLASLEDSAYDGIAVAGLQHERLIAPIKKLQDAGTKIVSLVSDLPAECRQHYIGIDNDKAGRSAARLVGLAHAGAAGQVVVATGSLEALDHLQRLEGFRAVLERDYPNIKIVHILETRDNPQVMRESLIDTFTGTTDISALYNVGAGNVGLIEALRTVKRPDRFFCIVHELSDTTRTALADGIIDIAIDQSPEIELNRATAMLRAVVDNLPAPPNSELTPVIYLRDNLPEESHRD